MADQPLMLPPLTNTTPGAVDLIHIVANSVAIPKDEPPPYKSLLWLLRQGAEERLPFAAAIALEHHAEVDLAMIQALQNYPNSLEDILRLLRRSYLIGMTFDEAWAELEEELQANLTKAQKLMTDLVHLQEPSTRPYWLGILIPSQILSLLTILDRLDPHHPPLAEASALMAEAEKLRAQAIELPQYLSLRDPFDQIRSLAPDDLDPSSGLDLRTLYHHRLYSPPWVNAWRTGYLDPQRQEELFTLLTTLLPPIQSTKLVEGLLQDPEFLSTQQIHLVDFLVERGLEVGPMNRDRSSIQLLSTLLHHPATETVEKRLLQWSDEPGAGRLFTALR